MDRRPNILFIIVDELRYWRVFPEGINNVGKFLHQFMPNTYRRLCVPGVKFAGHYTAGVACTPARGTLITGRYTQQNWELATILDSAPPTPAFTSVSTDRHRQVQLWQAQPAEIGAICQDKATQPCFHPQEFSQASQEAT